jgi:hypothetical protein
VQVTCLKMIQPRNNRLPTMMSCNVPGREEMDFQIQMRWLYKFVLVFFCGWRWRPGVKRPSVLRVLNAREEMARIVVSFLTPYSTRTPVGLAATDAHRNLVLSTRVKFATSTVSLINLRMCTIALKISLGLSHPATGSIACG